MPSDASSDVPSPDTAGDGSRTAVAKVLALLLAFEGDRASLCLTELARQTGLPLSTTHRLVGELLDAGLLRREAAGGYRVSRRLWKIGQNAGRALQETVRPSLAELFRLTGGVNQLAIRDGDDALIVDRVFGPGQASHASRVGGRLPLHACAMGKAILAFEDREVQDRYLARPLDAITRATQVDPAVLARQFADIRRNGYAFSVEEARLGSAAIAVPVLVGGQRAVAALGLVAPIAQRRRLVGLLPALRSTATALALDVPRWPHPGARGVAQVEDASEDVADR
jgi:DNA-binding IclR family transcriptional regulator